MTIYHNSSVAIRLLERVLSSSFVTKTSIASSRYFHLLRFCAFILSIQSVSIQSFYSTHLFWERPLSCFGIMVFTQLVGSSTDFSINYSPDDLPNILPTFFSPLWTTCILLTSSLLRARLSLPLYN